MNSRLLLAVSLSAVLGAACPPPTMMGTGGGGATGGGTAGGNGTGGGPAGGGGGMADCASVCAAATNQAAACSAGCAGSCAAQQAQAAQRGCAAQFDQAMRCYLASSTPFTCDAATLTPPSGCGAQTADLTTCFDNAFDGGAGGGGGATGGGGGTGGGAVTGGGGGASSPVSLCQMWDAPVLVGEVLASTTFRSPRGVVAVTTGGALFGWYDGYDVHWLEKSPFGVDGALAVDLDAGFVSDLTVRGAGTHGLGAYTAQENTISVSETRTRRFENGWDALTEVTPPSQNSGEQLLSGLEPSGTATLWRVWTPAGASAAILSEVRSNGVGPLSEVRTLADAGVFVHFALTSPAARMVGIAENDVASVLITTGSGDTSVPIGSGVIAMAGAMSDDGQTFAAAATLSDAGQESVFGVTQSGSSTTLSSQPGATRVLGALSAQARSLILWTEQTTIGSSVDLFVARENGGWGAPQSLATSAANTFNFYALTESVGIVTWYDGNGADRWLELRTDGFTGTPSAPPNTLSVSAIAGRAGHVAVIGTSTLADGGTGIYTAQCR